MKYWRIRCLLSTWHRWREEETLCTADKTFAIFLLRLGLLDMLSTMIESQIPLSTNCQHAQKEEELCPTDDDLMKLFNSGRNFEKRGNLCHFPQAKRPFLVYLFWSLTSSRLHFCGLSNYFFIGASSIGEGLRFRLDLLKCSTMLAKNRSLL